MPPAVVTGIGFVAKLVAAKGVAALATAAAFTAFVKGAVIGFAFSHLLRALIKKPSQPDSPDASGVAGSTRGLIGSTIPKRWVLGRARVAGGLAWFREVDERWKYEVHILSAGPCDGIERVWAHGEEVEMVRDGNVLMPVPDSKYWGTREESYTETYTERVPVGSGGDGRDTGPTPSPSPSPSPPSEAPFVGPPSPGDFRAPPDSVGPGGEGAGCACGACRGGGGPGPDGSCAPGGFRASDGFWEGYSIQRALPGRGIDLSPWAISRYNEAVQGTAASAGAAASDGVSGEQGEGGGRDGLDPTSPGRGQRPSRTSGYTVVTRTRTRTREVRVPLIKITEYFKADGSEGAEIRALAAGADGETELEWTEAHRLNGVSYVLVELFQPDYDDIDDRFWPARPQINYLMRGLKVQYPIKDVNAPGGRRLTDPEWTDNAAILRYWYLTERRNIAPELIDIDYFESARRLCDEDLNLSSAQGYTADYPDSVKRYTINGSVTSGGSASALDAQFDFAWQGFVVEANGNLLFRPGHDLPSRFTIGEKDIINDPLVRIFGARSDLANEMSVQIEQSTNAEYLPEDFEVVDGPAQASDGERLVQELTQLKFVIEPVQAINFLHQRLLQQRGLTSMELHVKSPPDWRYHTLIAGDKIEVNLPEHGIGDGGALRYFRVTGVQVSDDFSVNLNLLEWPDGLHQDQFEFPPRQQKFNVQPRRPAAPVGRGSIDWNVNRDGNTVWTAFLSWDATPHETVVRVDSPQATEQSKRTRDNSVSFDLTRPGVYTFNLRHITREGLSSAQSQVQLSATYEDIPLPKPVVLDAAQNGNLIDIRVRNVPDRDIDGLEVRYRSLGLDATFADIPTITDADWDDAPQMNVSPVTPVRGTEDALLAQALLPASGTYRIYVRLRNRVGNLSPLSDVRNERYEIAAAATGSVTSQPQWEGTLVNLILWPHDGENRLLTDRALNVDLYGYDAWDGSADFPFGVHTGRGRALGVNARTSGKTVYVTKKHEFRTPDGLRDSRRREVYVAIEAVAPDGKLATNPQGFEITLQYEQSGILVRGTVVEDGALTNIENVDAVQAFVNFYNQRNHALVAVTIGWREVD